ncbi:hypothetical protein BC940DRAFT_303058 [Gongronella butleri]|nr:hypothetical protein BC940DRAFT_303058 [Gongronella butleri]
MSDPRRPEKVVPYHLPAPTEDASDWHNNFAMYIAMAGIFFRNQYKVIPWLALYFGLSAYLNGRKSVTSKDSFGSNNGIMIAVVSFITFYINFFLMHRKALAQLDSPEGL